MEKALKPSGYVYQPTYEWCTFPSLQLNLESRKLFFPNEGKVPHEWPGYCHQHCLSLDFVVVMMLICPYHALCVVIIDTEQDEDKSNFPFFLGSWDFWLNLQFLCTVFFYNYPKTCYCLSKSLWYSLCLLGVTWMLWIHM